MGEIVKALCVLNQSFWTFATVLHPGNYIPDYEGGGFGLWVLVNLVSAGATVAAFNWWEE